MSANWVEVCRDHELADGKAVVRDIDGVSVLVCRLGDRFHAVSNECSHAFQCLEGGIIRAGWIACPAHGARFDLESGEPLNPPATAPIAVYPTRVDAGIVSIDTSSIA